MTTIKTLTELANFLRNMPDDGVLHNSKERIGFNMRRAEYHRPPGCSLACCIAGWAALLNPELSSHRLPERILALAANEGKKIPHREADILCYPFNDITEYDMQYSGWNSTPQQAARAIEILLETGVCDWKRAMMEVA